MPRVNLEDLAEAVKCHEAKLLDGMTSGDKKWMAAVWKIENGEVVLVGRTTWDFPIEDLKTAANLLENDCQQEINSCPQIAFGQTLPRACGATQNPFGIVTTEPEEVKETIDEGWPIPDKKTIDNSIETIPGELSNE